MKIDNIFIRIKSLRIIQDSYAVGRHYSSSSKSLAKILASDSIEKICGEVFKSRGHELVEKPGIKKDELIKIIDQYDGLVVRSGTKVTKEIINAGVNLKIIGRAGTGKIFWPLILIFCQMFLMQELIILTLERQQTKEFWWSIRQEATLFLLGSSH